MSRRNLLGLPERRPTLPHGLGTTGSGIPCIDPGGGGWFGRMAEQSPLAGYEPKNPIEISSQHTSINVPFLHGETISIPSSATCPPLLRLVTQTLWMREQ